MSNKTFLSFLLISAVFLTGCTSTSTTSPEESTSQVQQKQGDTTITGKLSGSENAYFIQESGKTPIMIDSYSLDFGQYVGQVVTIVGQYSGDTLFVSEIR